MENVVGSLGSAVECSLDARLPQKLCGLATVQDLKFQHEAEKSLCSDLSSVILKDCMAASGELVSKLVSEVVPKHTEKFVGICFKAEEQGKRAEKLGRLDPCRSCFERSC